MTFPMGWEEANLGEVISLEYGKPLPKPDRDDNGAFPAYGANGVKCRTNKYYYGKATIIVGRKGSAGELNLSEEKFWPLDVTYYVKFNEDKYDLYFLYYYLSCLNLPSLATGVKPGINRNNVYALKCAFPSLPEQQRIVAILDDAFERIDAAIANTEKNLANARELFESYLNEVFTKVPDKWNKRELKDILDIQPRNGWSPPANHHSDSGIPVLTLSAVTGFIFRGDKIKYTSAPVNESAHYWVNNGDLLITRSNTNELVGHVAICEGLSQATIYPDLIMRMKVDPRKALTEFVYYQLRSEKIREIIRTSATGANPTMKKIKKSIVQGLPIAYPSIAEQRGIVASLDELTDKTQALERLCNTKLNALAELKKSILQKAFAGELTADMNQEALVN